MGYRRQTDRQTNITKLSVPLTKCI